MQCCGNLGKTGTLEKQIRKKIMFMTKVFTLTTMFKIGFQVSLRRFIIERSEQFSDLDQDTLRELTEYSPLKSTREITLDLNKVK